MNFIQLEKKILCHHKIIYESHIGKVFFKWKFLKNISYTYYHRKVFEFLSKKLNNVIKIWDKGVLSLI